MKHLGSWNGEPLRRRRDEHTPGVCPRGVVVVFKTPPDRMSYTADGLFVDPHRVSRASSAEFWISSRRKAVIDGSRIQAPDLTDRADQEPAPAAGDYPRDLPRLLASLTMRSIGWAARVARQDGGGD